MDFHSNFLPDFTNFDNVVLAASIFLFYAGMEMSGVHVRDISNPAVNYPKAVFGGAIVTVLIFVLGTYALGVIIPAKDINLVQSLLVGFDNSPISREAVIPISTVGQQIDKIAYEAVSLLVEQMNEQKKRRPVPLTEPIHKIITPVLLKRETTEIGLRAQSFR